jgi:redox-sensitive bicupin YhaK (pirin superfamily)
MMGFRSLRVINEDFVMGGEGFPTHAHRDMEIVTYILSGSLEHKDSMGTGSVIKVGDVQYMSAGRGVTHSEYNHSGDELVHLLQIWIMPSEKSAVPRYDQKHFTVEERKNRLRLIVSNSGSEGSIAVRQDVELYACLLDSGKTVRCRVPDERHGWLHVAKGALTVNGVALSAGDSAAVVHEPEVVIVSQDPKCEFLLFNLS